ncbi:thiol-disulfide interchange protein DsbC [Candidatus Ruthia magnifica str. Cm (Calyptogena magnifica)]|uniref:Thiol:disulfide interchange protein n=1 Tax=Ruthia magnifica subsp. Calyptogena magnifica TaxID=413404 RepID=A1AVP1_RUTMC|nr:thioredoxin fold domain-containing protein [Candidatus Ruthturnera calyptogenae]ABL01998.1 thiol-disulfide interchange protein DsbC [Candidatus Ruthia magnifica str. Cm (Calyptogena magnifica)]
MLKLLFITTVLFSNNAFADKNAIINTLYPFFGTIDKQYIINTPLSDIFEITLRNLIDSLLVSKNDRYLIQNNVVDLTTTARQLIPMNGNVKLIKQALINTIDDHDKIIYPAKNEKYIIHVFTDVDCPFCKKLHNGMKQMNDLGITVKYLASPLASLHPAAQGKMERIWCADDPVKAMDDYKKNKIILNLKTCHNPVANQLAISKQLGVNGVPTIFLEDGTHLLGYMTPAILLQKIKATIGK